MKDPQLPSASPNWLQEWKEQSLTMWLHECLDTVASYAAIFVFDLCLWIYRTAGHYVWGLKLPKIIDALLDDVTIYLILLCVLTSAARITWKTLKGTFKNVKAAEVKPVDDEL